MHVRLIGDAHDVTGFSLAGLDCAECHTRAELMRAIDAARLDADIAVIVVSPATAGLAPELIEEMREASRLPITVVLPPRPEAEDTSGEVSP